MRLRDLLWLPALVGGLALLALFGVGLAIGWALGDR